jgi:hypothetical protein
MAKAPKPAPKPTTDKLGEFEIPMEAIEGMPDLVRRIMGECIVMRAEFMYATKSVKYVAMNEAFEEREQGAETPTYEPSYDEDSDILTWTKAE